MTLEIRSADADRDLPDLVRLNGRIQELHRQHEPEVFAAPEPAAIADWFADVLARDAWAALVAEVEGAAAGYLLYELVDRTADTFTRARRSLYVHQIGVAPDARRRGIGRALLGRAGEAARSSGRAEVALDTWAFNAAAIAFFEACGYAVYNHRLRKRTGGRSRDR